MGNRRRNVRENRHNLICSLKTYAFMLSGHSTSQKGGLYRSKGLSKFFCTWAACSLILVLAPNSFQRSALFIYLDKWRSKEHERLKKQQLLQVITKKIGKNSGKDLIQDLRNAFGPATDPFTVQFIVTINGLIKA